MGFYIRFSDTGRPNFGDDGDPVPSAGQVKDASAFSGVEFLTRHALAPAKELPEAVAQPTWRQLSSRMGSILWHLRRAAAIRQPFFLLLKQGGLPELWSRVGAEAVGGWNRQANIADVGFQVLFQLEGFLRTCAHGMRRVARPPCVDCVSSAKAFAVDATRAAMAYVQFSWTGHSLH